MSASPRYFAPIDFKARFPALDGIRALAVSMVFAMHYGGGAHGGGVLRAFNTIRLYGWIGVDIFFVLSGFLITGILFDTRADSQFFKRFFARRAVRIFPVFFLVLLVLLLLTPVFRYQWHWIHLTYLIYMANVVGSVNHDVEQLVSANHRAASASLAHFWSLCVEEQFYLVWPLVVWFVRDRIRLLWTAAGLCVLAMAMRLAITLHYGSDAPFRLDILLPFRMDSLLIGAMLALVLRGPAADRWQRSGKWFLLAGFVAYVIPSVLSNDFYSPLQFATCYTLLGLFGAGLVCVTLRAGSPAFRLFYYKPLRILGKYSYGFYVFHTLFVNAWIALLIIATAKLHSLARAGLIVLPLNFAITFLAAKLSYDLIESRFLRLKRGFEYDSEITEHKHAFTVK